MSDPLPAFGRMTEAAGPSAADARRALDEDGHLLLRGGLPSSFGSGVLDDVRAALHGWGLLREAGGEVPRWSGRPAGHLDRIALERCPRVRALSRALAAQAEPAVHALAALLLGDRARTAARVHVYCAIPDDPRHSSPPHQDTYGTDGDAFRLWIPLTTVAFGDSGLAVARGSHRLGRREQAVQPGYLVRPVHPDWGETPTHPDALDWGGGAAWVTADVRRGDVVVMHPDVVHASTPPASDRVRVAIAVDVSATPLAATSEVPWPELAETWESARRDARRDGVPRSRAWRAFAEEIGGS